MQKFKYNDIKSYVKENSECKLISTEYLGIRKKMLFKCKCGNKFEVSFSNFKYNNKRSCNECNTFKLDKKICPICLKEFRPRNFKTIYCCKKCKDESQIDRIYYNCEYCGKKAFAKKVSIKKAKNIIVAENVLTKLKWTGFIITVNIVAKRHLQKKQNIIYINIIFVAITVVENLN